MRNEIVDKLLELTSREPETRIDEEKLGLYLKEEISVKESKAIADAIGPRVSLIFEFIAISLGLNPIAVSYDNATETQEGFFDLEKYSTKISWIPVFGLTSVTVPMLNPLDFKFASAIPTSWLTQDFTLEVVEAAAAFADEILPREEELDEKVSRYVEENYLQDCQKVFDMIPACLHHVLAFNTKFEAGAALKETMKEVIEQSKTKDEASE